MRLMNATAFIGPMESMEPTPKPLSISFIHPLLKPATINRLKYTVSSLNNAATINPTAGIKINPMLTPCGLASAPGEMGAFGLKGGGGVGAPGGGGDECSHRLILRPFPSV